MLDFFAGIGRKGWIGILTVVALGWLGAGWARAGDAPATTRGDESHVLWVLTKPIKVDLGAPVSVLGREIYRQALLIAARDDLGLQTRDGSLREWHDAPPAMQTLNVIAMGKSVSVVSGDGAETMLWHLDVPKSAWGPGGVMGETIKAEEYSRGAFVSLLKQRGFSGTERAANNKDGAAPDDAEAKLAEMDELSQFEILRETHELIRKDGESEARLGVLVRGYANLGQLTRFHWSVEHEVFEARALLYAQRMVSADPQSAWALWHRAYATALAGLQGQATKDLESAAAMGESGAPGWVKLLGPFCRDDVGELIKLSEADRSQMKLGVYLAFVAVETSGVESAAQMVGNAALKVNPHCVRVVDSMCDCTSTDSLEELTEAGPRIFGQTLEAELGAMAGLPDAVLKQTQNLSKPGGDAGERKALCETLVEQGSPDKDVNEMSWAVLGRLIEETTFAQISRRANVMAMMWEQDASAYVTEMRPMIEGHRFQWEVEACGALHSSSRHGARNFLRKQSWDDLTTTELPLYRLEVDVKSKGEDTADGLLGFFEGVMDPCSFEREAWILLYKQPLTSDEMKDDIKQLKMTNPQSPWVVCFNIANHWDPEKAKNWEADHGSYPSIALALGNKYVELRQWEDAERCLNQYLTVSPDMKGYKAVADIYEEQNQMDRWLGLWKAYLEKNKGTDGDQWEADVKIADYYMSKHQYQEALSYADAAAANGASRGLLCAAQAHTGTGDFKGAEESYITEYQRWSSSPYNWYCWCVMTGHGDKAGAEAALHDYFSSHTNNLSNEDLIQLACLDELGHKTGDAIGLLQRRFKLSPGPLSLIHIMVFADDAGDAATREAAINGLEFAPNEDSAITEFAQELRRAYPNGALKTRAIDALLEKDHDGDDRIQICYFTARYLIKRGHKDQAINYLKRCYFGFSGYCVDRILVDQALRDNGIDPYALEFPAAAATQPGQ